MEKILNEEELKILEEEIDQAVDRLFVEKKKTQTDVLPAESIPLEPLLEPFPQAHPPPSKPSPQPPFMETPYRMEPSPELEQIFAPQPPLSSPSKSLDRMESRLLSLEWEITEENLLATKEEVINLKGTLKENPSALSILKFMEKALEDMIQSKGNVHPSFIQFLLDSKETLRLLLEEEKDREIRTYKLLVLKGMEARFACLEPLRKVVKEPSSLQPEVGKKSLEILESLENKIRRISDQVDAFPKRIEESIQQIQKSLDEINQRIKNRLESPPKENLMAQVLIFKANGRLFGIESQKVVKLFKIPSPLYEKYANFKRLQLKELEVKMVNLQKVFSMEGDLLPAGGGRILTVKDNGEVKGLMIDEIVKRLSAQLKILKTGEPYFSGTIEWIYQDQVVEIPILNLTKL